MQTTVHYQSLLASFFVLSCLLLAAVPDAADAKKTSKPNDIMGFAQTQLAQTASEINTDEYPYHTDRDTGEWITRSSSAWISGFFPGSLWQMYEWTDDSAWRDLAAAWTAGIEGQEYRTDTHDLGFMIFNSFGNGYLLTEESATRRPLPLCSEWLAENVIVGGISRVQASGFALDAKRGEFIPEVAQVDTAHIEHSAGSGHDPTHSGTFHAVFDDTPAGPFDDAGGDGEAVLEVDVVGHAMGIVVEVPADALQRIAALTLERVVRAEPAQGVDHGGDLAVEHASCLLFDEGAGGFAAVGMEQERALPEVTEGVEQIEDLGDV